MSDETSTKLGLALSGGGFRASFFHIGVLARLADLGLLRHVEVLSTVSGGSIIGALYYLHVKKLLEEKEDMRITDEDYQNIIGKIEVDFLQAVQRNLRFRTFLNPLKNLKMSLANYSRSDYIGELYDKFLFRNVLDPKNIVPIKMKDLKIRPLGEGLSFHPSVGNKTRKAKVPILLMNATVLNDGHNWRFSAEYMGESTIDEPDETIDKNFRLKRTELYENIYKHGDFPLGVAVAASACLPGVFAPLAISDLYDDGIRVQLVDGGTHDNQGIVGLLDKKLKCTHFIISDASGQMNDEKEPQVQIPKVLKRINSIFMDRIREQQLSRLLKEHVDNVALLHLKKGLPVKEISYFDKDHKLHNKTVLRKTEPSSQAFGVNEDVQTLLSRVRTDLDSFSEVEAFSLMLDGYKMSEYEFNCTNIINLVTNTSLREKKYQFFKIEKWVSSPIVDHYYKRHLESASKRIFRVVKLSLLWSIVIKLVVAFICAVLINNYSHKFIQWTNDSTKNENILLILLLLIILFGFYFSRYISYRNPVARFLLNGLPTALISLIGSVFIGIHLLTFDRLFLHLGRLEVLERAQKKSKGDLRVNPQGK
ncbi:Patatin-like phospholipase [Bacillus sp. OV166]|uniref:patatin-like phospholipase family protein n=1 Tax=Bacillus sp. OV166 TaxID=1882763 RepID=UPI000A2AC0C8|nr:patatin-like phospholipase family protein [Bacillus sp. OV166]SMQ78450.1 Patatin-like phospholipase [Bacillus sp. OV166]